MQARTASHQDLKNLELTHHILMVTEDWNEPDLVAVGTSSMFIWRDTVYVHTPVTMRFKGDGPGGQYPDSVTVCVVSATYHDNDCADIVVWAEEGKIGYTTFNPSRSS